HLKLHRHRLPLTWILHSLGVNLNQYGALNPRLIQQECQHRHSICATTEGLGPDGWYFDKSEQDFWSVWRALATSYRLDPRRAVISGYSMGGWASYKLGLAHPDLFSQAMSLEGPPNCGIRLLVLSGEEIAIKSGAGATGHCRDDGRTLPLLGNARWLPYTMTQGGIDELVPAPSNPQQANQLRQLGLRYTLYFLPADDHLVYATQDRFGGIVGNLGTRVPKVKRNPARIRYSWYPDLTSHRLGIGASTAYWVTRMAAATRAPGAIASMRVHSFGRRDRAIRPFSVGPTAVTTPLPATRTGVRWHRGARPARRDRLRLRLSRVKSLTVNARRAGLECPRVVANADHRVRLVLTHLRSAGGHRQVVSLGKGRSVRRPDCS
ncbi:MAG: prolyl oligopeptidase family serine peptidase, partial [Frankiaceae bacterium]|nr:prolyl oligopeptidase family serine peptidase [Frankiaceae bacterium]